MTPTLFVKTAIVALLSLPALARAHYVWIESDSPTAARLYFGEYNEGVREKAGGRLDERAALEAWLEQPDGRKQALDLVKNPDHFSASSSGAGWLLAVDRASEVKDYRKQEIGIVKPMFYARAALGNKPSSARPSLELDILPVPGKPGSLGVFFAGKPLAGAKVHVYAPNLWMQELKSDENGRLTPLTPWPGRYVLDVIHKQAKPGKFKGQPYEAIRHRMTYSFVR